LGEVEKVILDLSLGKKLYYEAKTGEEGGTHRGNERRTKQIQQEKFPTSRRQGKKVEISTGMVMDPGRLGGEEKGGKKQG